MFIQYPAAQRAVRRSVFGAALFIALPCLGQQSLAPANTQPFNAVSAPFFAAASPGCGADQTTVTFGGLGAMQECKSPGVWPIDNPVALQLNPVISVCVGPAAAGYTSVVVKGVGYFGWDDVGPGQCSQLYSLLQTFVAIRIRP
jgi:hypothetical protein